MSTKESVNFCKLSKFLLDIGTKVSVERLSEYCRNYSTTFEGLLDDVNNKHKLYHLYKSTMCCECLSPPTNNMRILNNSQWDKLYHKRGPVKHFVKGQKCICEYFAVPNSLIELDLTLAICLLLSLCGPGAVEKSAIEKLRLIRNNVYGHAKNAHIDDPEFDTVWKDIELSINTILHGCSPSVQSSIPTEIQALKSTLIDPDMCKQITNTIQQVFERDSEFYQELHDMKQQFNLQLDGILKKLENFATVDQTAKQEIVELISRLSGDESMEISDIQHQMSSLHERFSDILPKFDNIEDLLKCIAKDWESICSLKKAEDSRNCWERKNNISKTIAEMKIHSEGIYLPSKAVDDAIKNLEICGVVMIKGIAGSGKYTHSVEILRKIHFDNILCTPHVILHPLSVDQWDNLVDHTVHSVVFLDNLFGKTNSNDFSHFIDKGLFRHILPCVKSGKVKLLITARTNVIDDCKEILETTDLFKNACIIDLSSDEYELKESEKKKLIDLYRSQHNVQIVTTENEEKSDLSCISNTTIKKIVATKTSVGFPLCCKNFFENVHFRKLGVRYFQQPTKTNIDEIEKLAKSSNDCEQKLFILLAYMMLKGGELSLSDNTIDWEILSEISDTLKMKMDLFMLQKAIKQALGRFVVGVHGEANRFKLKHATVLEAVCLAFESIMPEKLDMLVYNCSLTVLCELIRTNGCFVKDKEVAIKINRANNKFLVKRFLTEIKHNNFKAVILHSTMTDRDFLSEFLSELVREDNGSLFNGKNEQGRTFFNLSCVYNKPNLVSGLLKSNLIDTKLIEEGLMRFAFKFENVDVVKVLLPFLTKTQVFDAFMTSCRENKENMIEPILQFRHDLTSEQITKGLIFLCRYGYSEMVHILMSEREDLSKEQIISGFLEACKFGKAPTISIIMSSNHTLTCEQLTQGFHEACRYGEVSAIRLIIDSLSGLSSSEIELGLLNACQLGNTEAVKVILDKLDVSGDTIFQGLSNVIEGKRDGNVNNFTFHAAESDEEEGNPRQMGLLYSRHPSTSSDKTRRLSNTEKVEQKSISAPIVDYINKDTKLIRPPSRKNRRYKEEGSVIRPLLLCKHKLSSEQLFELFIKACRNGNLEFIREIFRQKQIMSISCIEEGLRMANKVPRPDIVEYLICEIDDLSDDQIAESLSCLVRRDAKVIGKILKKRKGLSVKDISKSFSEACGRDKAEIVEEYLINRPDLSDEQFIEGIECLCRNGKSESMQSILETKPDFPTEKLANAFTNACESDSDDIVVLLMKWKPEIPKEIIYNGFFIGCKSGSAKTISYFLQEITGLSNEIVIGGLKLACEFEMKAVVEIILEFKLDLTPEQIFQAFIFLCAHGDEHYLETVLMKKYDIGMYSNEGMVEACRFGRYEIVQLIVREFKTLTSERVTEGLVNACTIGRADIVSFILKDVSTLSNLEVNEGLLRAISFDNVDCVETILKQRPDLPEDSVLSGFICVCKYGTLPVMSLLLNEPYKLSSDGVKQGLHEACNWNRSDIVHQILVDCKTLTPEEYSVGFLYLCLNRHNDIVKEILMDNADLPFVYIKEGFCRACERSYTDIVETIVEVYNNLPREKLLDGILCICRNGKSDALNKILKRNSSLPLQYLTKGLTTANENGKLKIVTTILNSRNDIPYDQIVCSFACLCEHGNNEDIEMVLHLHSDIDDEVLIQGLLIACECNKPDIATTILRFAKDIPEEKISYVFTYLCKNGKPGDIYTVLKKYRHLHIDCVVEGLTSACESNRAKIVDAIVEERKYISPDKFMFGFTYLCKYGNSNCIRELLLLRPDLTTKVLSNGLSVALECRETETVETILQFRTDLPLRTIENGFEHLCGFGRTAVVEDLLYKRKDFTREVIGKGVRKASSEHRSEIVAVLLTQTTDLDHDTLTDAVCCACQYGSYEKLNTLLKQYPDMSLRVILPGLEAACKSDRFRIVEAVLYHRRDIMTKWIVKQFTFACRWGKSKTVLTILKQRQDVTENMILEGLNQATKWNKFETVINIIKERPNLSKNSISVTLAKACKYLRTDIVEILLQIRKDLNDEDFTCGFLCLSKSNKVKCIRQILDTKTDVSDVDLSLGFVEACESGGYEVVAFILDKRPIPLKYITKGLGKACKQGKGEIVKLILNKRKDLTTDLLKHAMLKARKKRHLNVVDIFMETIPELRSLQV